MILSLDQYMFKWKYQEIDFYNFKFYSQKIDMIHAWILILMIVVSLSFFSVCYEILPWIIISVISLYIFIMNKFLMKNFIKFENKIILIKIIIILVIYYVETLLQKYPATSITIFATTLIFHLDHYFFNNEYKEIKFLIFNFYSKEMDLIHAWILILLIIAIMFCPFWNSIVILKIIIWYIIMIIFIFLLTKS